MWLRAIDFCEKYNISSEALSIFKRKSPTEAFKKVSRREVYFDDNFFTRRKEFQAKVIEYNQYMYYRLLGDKPTLTLSKEVAPKLGISVGSLNNWFTERLFKNTVKSIIDYKLSSYHFKFYRYCKRIEVLK